MVDNIPDLGDDVEFEGGGGLVDAVMIPTRGNGLMKIVLRAIALPPKVDGDPSRWLWDVLDDNTGMIVASCPRGKSFASEDAALMDARRVMYYHARPPLRYKSRSVLVLKVTFLFLIFAGLIGLVWTLYDAFFS